MPPVLGVMLFSGVVSSRERALWATCNPQHTLYSMCIGPVVVADNIDRILAAAGGHASLRSLRATVHLSIVRCSLACSSRAQHKKRPVGPPAATANTCMAMVPCSSLGKCLQSLLHVSDKAEGTCHSAPVVHANQVPMAQQVQLRALAEAPARHAHTSCLLAVQELVSLRFFGSVLCSV